MDNARDIEAIVLAFAYQKPNLIFNDRYPLSYQDFESKFHKLIYSAMFAIYKKGGEITPQQVGYEISKTETLKKEYCDYGGEPKTTEIFNTSLEGFNYEDKYFDLKKNSLLKALNNAGINTVDIYDASKGKKASEKLEKMEYKDILEHYREKLASIEDRYENLIEKSGIVANEGLDELLQSLKEQPEIGMPLNGDLLNMASRGARRKKVYINSASSGSGKSRTAAGNVAKLGFYKHYDEKEGWIETGMNCPVLFITTELEHSEVQTMFLAYISGVNEEAILNNTYKPGERQRVLEAAEVIEKSPNVFIEFIPNPSIESVAAKIRLYALQKDIEYVFYDYVHVSSATYSNKKDMRDDVWLMLFVDKLKQLANELDIHISTATQISPGNSYDDKEIKNETMIRGSKAIADKADFAVITSAIIKEKEVALAKKLAAEMRTREPNQIIDVYKNRRGRWRSVRIWRYCDLGTCRSQDCFMTTVSNTPIDSPSLNIQLQTQQLVKEGAFPIIDSDKGTVVMENRKKVSANEF